MNLEKTVEKHESILNKILTMLSVNPLFNHDNIEKLFIEMNEGDVVEPEKKQPDEQRYK